MDRCCQCFIFTRKGHACWKKREKKYIGTGRKRHWAKATVLQVRGSDPRQLAKKKKKNSKEHIRALYGLIVISSPSILPGLVRPSL